MEYPEYEKLTAEESNRVAVWGKGLPESPKVYSQVAVSRKKGLLDVSFVPIVKRGSQYYKLTSFKMTLVRKAKPWKRGVRTEVKRSAGERYAAHSVLAQGRWVKIGITEDGIYRLTPSALRDMGFNDPARVKLYGYGGHVQDEVIDADNDFDDLEEVPLYRDSRGLLFFGRGLVAWSAPNSDGVSVHRTNTYARQACYFLTEGDSPATIEVCQENAVTGVELEDTPANILYKQEDYSWYQTGRMFYEAVNYASSNTHTYLLPSVDPVSSASLKVNFTAHSTSNQTTVRPVVNGVSESAHPELIMRHKKVRELIGFLLCVREQPVRK